MSQNWLFSLFVLLSAVCFLDRQVTIFGTDNDEDEYYDEDDYTVNHWDPYEPDPSENTVDIQAK